MKKNIFLTGATGVVGSSVLKELLSQANSQVVLLIRGENFEQRLNHLLNFLDLDVKQTRDRIQIVNSDVESSGFGLSKEKLKELADSITDVIHCAASVDLSQPEAQAMDFAKKSTENVLELLRLNSEIRLQYVSTVGVNGRRQTGLEEESVTEERKFFNTYEKSKAVSEEMVFREIQQGKKITIHRPSMVIGDSKSGKIIHFQVFYFLLRLVSGEFSRGVLPPVLHRKLDTIPCDFVAQVIVESMERSDLEGKVIHLCSGPTESFNLSQMVELVGKFKALPRRRIVPMSIFGLLGSFARLFPKESRWRTRLELLPQFLSYANQDQIFLNERSKSYFPNRIWPRPGDYLPKAIQYYVQKRRKS